MNINQKCCINKEKNYGKKREIKIVVGIEEINNCVNEYKSKMLYKYKRIKF